ncbi:MAG: hypothetical protein BGO41_11325 [Clostridiales bacterium 38-18]|nr:MAG: hypothetical protein BGO41_11325 [Clostridiales bacterium 38-18]
MHINDKKMIIDQLTNFIKYRSDSATEHERAFESILLEAIKNIPYFQNHSAFYGAALIESDPLHRSVVWALSGTEYSKTVILFGHHDTVDLSDYGHLDGTIPEEIRAYFSESEADASSGEWLFGRGSCDMKAGLVINLNQLRKATEGAYKHNILLISVPDEETLSVGMRAATELILELKEQHQLNFELAVLTEPHERVSDDEIVLSSGSVGKMMPIIVTKGQSTHSGLAYKGLNSVAIAMEVIKAIELNTEMGDVVDKRMTPPPTFLDLHTLREGYSVTTPEYTVATFNWLFLKGNLEYKMAQLKELCKWSAEDAINQYNYSYNEFLRKQNQPSYCDCHDINFEILLYDELVDRVKDQVDIDVLYNDIISANKERSIQENTALYIKALMGYLNADYPIVVIGLLPPFYPAVSSKAYFEDKLKAIIEAYSVENDQKIKVDHYFMGISDMSYMKASPHEIYSTLRLMPTFNREYKLPYDAIDALNIEVLHLGPWGKNLHLKGERVFIEDVTTNIPKLMDHILCELAK